MNGIWILLLQLEDVQKSCTLLCKALELYSCIMFEMYIKIHNICHYVILVRSNLLSDVHDTRLLPVINSHLTPKFCVFYDKSTE